MGGRRPWPHPAGGRPTVIRASNLCRASHHCTQRRGWTMHALIRLTLIAGTLLLASAGQAAPGKQSGSAYQVKDINAAYNPRPDASITSVVELGGAVYFGAKYGLWRSDGTPAGTQLVKQLDVSELTEV